ncbi:family 10 glycosylhydrolase [Serpentinicella alkaliphila]|uniref:Uncharacterized lipoprotein YddW (UPF0748 family) n=1 Tax=Serpentinicella alkaliphila TaxID=1734049 RepID=A0A4R2TR10_9FIRM|nr:family 10 glycosylhydrolase [Serpentinicella alkaliphila]QUH27126.1 family 10 glycosylhydrolase [Serpentinicella alkaliphila]TCQ05257.1 uncharacterized lipoprotein YddW (UPF0748 family) [Serpentinicella alkaliphila]
MLNKSYLSKFIVYCVAFSVLLVGLPVDAFATSTPWDQYKQFIPNESPVVKRHLRGAWISTVINLDWPSVETRNIVNDQERIHKTKEELISILDKSVEMNMNAVFFQVSPEGDALYRSDIVPWSRYLTGTFGKDPGFDPLAFAIEEAHKRNLQLHAWFNPYRISMNTNEATIQSLSINKSVYRDYPDWIRTTKSRFVIDPGIPGAREWVRKRVMEVVKNYDIDGIHFDDYFYYENFVGELEDDNTFMQFNTGQFSNKGDWRRNNTYLLVKEISNEIRSAKPWVKFGISPAAIWANKKDGHPSGSNTNAGLPNYDRSFADTKKWVEEEIIDYIAPQIYFTFANPHVPYGEAVSWWSEVTKNRKVHLYIGQALYKVNSDSDQYFQNQNAVDEFVRQHKFNVLKPEVMGSIMFRFRNFNDSNKQQVVNAMRQDLWGTKALVPVMDWKGGQAPRTPVQGKVEALSNQTKLTWIDNGGNTAYYAIYRMNKGNSLDIDSDRSALQLIGTVRKSDKTVQEFIINSSYDLDKIDFAITALDRLHNESKELLITVNQSRYFSDVNNQHAWAIKAIDNLYERGVINGVGNGRFAPGNNITRADFLVMVMNSYNIELDSNVTNNFADAGNKYYTKYLGTAKRLGLVSGVGNNLYSPETPITRQDMLVILHHVLDKLGALPVDNNVGRPFEEFKDINEIPSYALGAMKFFVRTGIVQGEGNRLMPRTTATRAQTAQVLFNIYTK